MEKLLNLLLNKRIELTEGLVNQPAPTLHDYHRRVGEIHGINLAIQSLQEVMAPGEDDE